MDIFVKEGEGTQEVNRNKVDDGTVKKGKTIPANTAENSILLMSYVVLVMGMFMPDLLVPTTSTLNGLFGFLRPLFITSKEPFKNGYLNPSIDLMQEFASGGVSWLLDSGATNHMTGSKDLVVDVHPSPSIPTHVQFADASSSKVL